MFLLGWKYTCHQLVVNEWASGGLDAAGVI